EVEGRLLEHPSGGECAVVGHRTDAGLEEVVACVVPAPGQAVDADALIAFCREGLAAFKRLRHVLALDALPKTATGKIQRVVVREVVARRLGKPGSDPCPSTRSTTRFRPSTRRPSCTRMR